MFDIVVEDLTEEQIAEEAAEYEVLTQSVRRLIDATIRTELRGGAISEAASVIDEVTEKLIAEQMPGPYGVRFTTSGAIRAWGNAASGLRNPIAAPLELITEEDGLVCAEVELGAAYEGPPTLVHGGISALLMDQALGRAAEVAGAAGLTGTLEVRYERAVRLGTVRVEAKLDRTEGVKSYAVGTISDDEGVCVKATGVFIMPKWAREARADVEQVREARAAAAGYSDPSSPKPHDQ